jgi:hypothetical protein
MEIFLQRCAGLDVHQASVVCCVLIGAPGPCAPCRKEMPTLDRLQVALAGSGALVVPLSLDSKGTSVINAFYKHDIPHFWLGGKG